MSKSPIIMSDTEQECDACGATAGVREFSDTEDEEEFHMHQDEQKTLPRTLEEDEQGAQITGVFPRAAPQIPAPSPHVVTQCKSPVHKEQIRLGTVDEKADTFTVLGTLTYESEEAPRNDDSPTHKVTQGVQTDPPVTSPPPTSNDMAVPTEDDEFVSSAAWYECGYNTGYRNATTHGLLLAGMAIVGYSMFRKYRARRAGV